MKNGILGRLRYRAGFGFGAGNFQGLFSAFFYRVEGRFFAITFQMRTKKHHQKSSNLKKPSKKPKKHQNKLDNLQRNNLQKTVGFFFGIVPKKTQPTLGKPFLQNQAFGFGPQAWQKFSGGDGRFYGRKV